MIRDVLRGLISKPVTEHYPAEEADVAPNFRGQLHWTTDACTGCNLCVKDCPADAIELITLDKASKRFVMRYQADRCIFCTQCMQSCRFDCWEAVNDDWELATQDRATLTTYYGNPDDIRIVLEGDSSTSDSTETETE